MFLGWNTAIVQIAVNKYVSAWAASTIISIINVRHRMTLEARGDLAVPRASVLAWGLIVLRT
jgi:hypothetical protein